MKNHLLLFAFALLPLTTSGQDSTITLRRTPRAVIKFAPLSLLDNDATVQGGLEYQTGIRTSVQGEFGYGRKGLSPFGGDLNSFVQAEVWRGRAEVRFYSGRYRTNRRRGIAFRSDFPLGNYWAIDGLFKQINVVKRDNLYSGDAASQTGSFVLIGTQQRLISRYVLGSHLKIGRQFAFYDPQRRVFSRALLDIYFGAGVRWAVNDVPPPPFDPITLCGCGLGRSFNNTESRFYPSLSAGLKFGFAL